VLRGFLEFGALVHMVEAIVGRMLPFMMLLGLVVLGFSFSMHLLLQHAPQGQGGFFDDELLSIYNVVNMGFRFVPPNASLMRSYWQVVLLYEVFMMLVQIVMLNLLIAFMAQLLGQLRTNAQLMAHFERAILVIEQEQTLRSRRNLEHQRKQRQRERKQKQRGLRHTLRHLRTRLGDTQEMLGKLLPWLTLPSQEDVGPRWLHVLLPSESLVDSKGDAKAPVPPPKAAEEKQGQAKQAQANDELKHLLVVQLSQIETRLLEQLQAMLAAR